MTLPNLIIPGAQKSGTTSFVQLLETHEDIYTGERKEPHFFSKDRKYLRGVDLYKSYYLHYRGQRIIVDASQSYMPLNFVPERIAETLGNHIRFIIVLRNPIDRVISAFTHFRIHKGGETMRNLADVIPKQLEGLTLEKLIAHEEQSVRSGLSSGSLQSRNDTWSKSGFPFNYFYVSCYSRHISTYFRYFPKRDFLFLTFEQVTQHRGEAIHKVGGFLEVDPSGFNVSSNIHANPSLVYKSRMLRVLSPIKETLKRLLPRSTVGKLKALEREWLMEKPGYRFSSSTYHRVLEIFQPEIYRVERLTGLDLSSWKVECRDS
jgi:hypothetical protein